MSLSRRSFLTASATAGLLVPAVGLAGSRASASPGLLRARPTLTHGIASGDPRTDGALVWARSDTPARMIVEASPLENFALARRFVGPVLTPATDGTGRVRVTGMPPGATVHYRVTLESDRGTRSAPLTGTFRTAPVLPGTIRMTWSGDVAGQGWGIDPARGGMRGFGAVADRHSDLFLHSGDTIYADNPLTETVDLGGGQVWRNRMSTAKSAVAQTLDEFRGNHSYNLTDANYRRLAASTTQLVQWDDHETFNNWFPGEIVANPAYTQEKRADVLAARALRAFHEWQPVSPVDAVDGRVYRKVSYGPLLDIFVLDMRSYKDSNSDSRASAGGHILGDRQARWLVDGLNSSRAVWKIVANDLPLGIVVPDSTYGDPGADEAVAQGDNGSPLGREVELAGILRRTRGVRNVVWLTADVHYTAANHYHPDRGAVGDFRPFWEFVSGPLHAGAFPAGKLDRTFGVEQVFVHAPTTPNVGPAVPEFQHFGEVEIDGLGGRMAVSLFDATGARLHRTDITRE
ncbi:alkaline phosphatase D family protein [Williamsia deligens]|uniref:Alkaline phosphatase D family protein n=1 Tax=Williamsia deligens TaxID=321325 RepID=A0ABW3G7E6_9NOCA|nr:alkaline phosphatase D family protein [Williamsia deligens]MCP2194279.1 alkaline phosphatase D [Williamsia deligens]